MADTMNCAGCGHSKEDHLVVGCVHVTDVDAAGFVRDRCFCPVFIEPVSI